MVDLQVVVKNATGQGIEGIPVRCFVINNNQTDPFASSKYWINLSNTNSNGSTTYQNAQGYASFTCYANQNSSNPDYTSGQGTTSTTDLSGGFTEITLQSIVQPIVDSSGTVSCPNGYTLTNNQCVQNSTTQSIFSEISNWISSHLWQFIAIDITLVIVIILAYKGLHSSPYNKIKNLLKHKE